MGADGDAKDVVRVDARADELEAIGVREVKEELGGALGQRAKQAGGIARLGEPVADLVSDLITLPADARAEGSQEVARVDAAAVAQAGDRPLQDPPQRAPPAAVDGGDDAPGLVDHKDGQAVGRLDHEEQPGTMRDQRVAVRALLGSAIQDMDDIGVDLAQQHGAEGPQALIAAEHGRRQVAIAESVCQPRYLIETRNGHHGSRHLSSLS